MLESNGRVRQKIAQRDTTFMLFKLSRGQQGKGANLCVKREKPGELRGLGSDLTDNMDRSGGTAENEARDIGLVRGASGAIARKEQRKTRVGTHRAAVAGKHVTETAHYQKGVREKAGGKRHVQSSRFLRKDMTGRGGEGVGHGRKDLGSDGGEGKSSGNPPRKIGTYLPV